MIAGPNLTFGPEGMASVWNSDIVLNCWVQGGGREEFLQDVNKEMENVVDKYDEFDKMNNAVAVYQVVHDVVMAQEVNNREGAVKAPAEIRMQGGDNCLEGAALA